MRAQMNFKATPVRKYTSKLGQVEEKSLTMPVGPNLRTKGRADIKNSNTEE